MCFGLGVVSAFSVIYFFHCILFKLFFLHLWDTIHFCRLSYIKTERKKVNIPSLTSLFYSFFITNAIK